MSHLSPEVVTDAYILIANFSKFCIACIVPNLADISNITARLGREWYARGRPVIVWDTGILVMSHFLREIVSRTPIYPIQFFPNFALAVLTTIEQIFPLFQRDQVENGTPEVDQS